MALNSQYSASSRNAAADAIGNLGDNGYIRVYSGAQPANAAAAATGVLLAELRLPADGFLAAVAGVISAGVIATVAALATGTAGWVRVLKSDGVTVLFDGSVGTAAANLVMNSVEIQAGADVGVSSLQLTVLAAGS
jgi:hypothetical protein